MNVNNNSTKKYCEYISNINITRSYFSKFHLLPNKNQEFPQVDAISRVKELWEKLEKVANINRVRVKAPKFPDIHWLEFELELQSAIELSDEVWNYVQDLVIDCEWSLRDDTGEQWYFHTQTVTDFSKFDNGYKVVNLDQKPQIYSFNLNLREDQIINCPIS